MNIASKYFIHNKMYGTLWKTNCLDFISVFVLKYYFLSFISVKLVNLDSWHALE